MSLKLYIFNGSPPSRTALLASKALGLDVDVHVINASAELNTPELLKINPTHKAPFLIDNDKIIGDSHAIAAYLVGKYANDDSLYPKDLYQRALVDEKLYFDTGVLFSTLRGGFTRKEYKKIPQDQINAIKDAYAILQRILGDNRWLVGNNVTIADISCATTTSSLAEVYPIDPKIFPSVDGWLKNVQSLPFFKEDSEQVKHFKEFVNRAINWC